MITVSEENGKRRVEINASSLSVIQECMRKSQYLLFERWKAQDESPATIFGSAIHRALEVFYAAPVKEREMIPLEELEIIALTQPERDWTKEPLLMHAISEFAKKAEPLRMLPDLDKRSITNGTWILWHYFKTFIDDPYTTYVDKDGPFLERSFTLRFHETDDLIIDLFGTIDFAFRHNTNGNIILGDHKTSSSLGFGGQSYYDRDKPNHQYTVYALGANKVFGISTEEFMVNVIEVKLRVLQVVQRSLISSPDYAKDGGRFRRTPSCRSRCSKALPFSNRQERMAFRSCPRLHCLWKMHLQGSLRSSTVSQAKHFKFEIQQGDLMKLSEVRTDGALKILLYGAAGTGKTCFAAGLPTPILYLDFDNKVDSAALFFKNDKSRLEEIDVRQLAPTLTDSPIAELERIIREELIPQQKAGKMKYKTIVLDSLTTFSSATLKYIVDTNPG